MSGAGYWFLLHVAPSIDKAVIPRTNGKYSSTGKHKVGLVTTTGARTGQPRTHPLVLIDDGGGLLAIASNYGRPPHTAWSHNLLANPECEVEFKGPRTPYRAELLAGEARDAAWQTAVDFYAGYARYKERCASREIRIFRLRPS